jgi:ABC-type molybdate transport system substrate-binding protein
MKIDLRRPVAALAAIALLTFAPVSAQTSAPVSVLYAGSLVTPMEGPIKTALAAKGIDFQGQGAGSKMLANLISSGVKSPDVFISVDPKLVLGLGAKVAGASTSAGRTVRKTQRCSKALPTEKPPRLKRCRRPAS